MPTPLLPTCACGLLRHETRPATVAAERAENDGQNGISSAVSGLFTGSGSCFLARLPVPTPST